MIDVDRLGRRRQQRLAHLIDNVLDFARLERGKASYHFAEGRLEEAVERALDVLRYRLEKERMRLRTEIHDGLPAVRGDSVQLRQVILNLLLNAEDAIVLAEDGPREIQIDASRPDPAHVAVVIRDSGVGVKESELERVFEHFVTTKPEGLGMGLAISRSIVEAHDGRIWATRNTDRGLTLHVELPAA